VNSPPLSVSTRLTFGFSLPDTAAVSVVNNGLFDAATVTGSCAMPVTEPGPVGTLLAYVEQPGPTRSAAGSVDPTMGGLVIGAAAAVVDGVDGAELAMSLEHADRPNTATAASPAIAPVLY